MAETPQLQLEASGITGMKATLNGVPSLRILDAWWIEGCVEGVTGWAIGELPNPANVSEEQSPRDAASALRYAARNCTNVSFFNTQRMGLQYVTKAYLQ